MNDAFVVEKGADDDEEGFHQGKQLEEHRLREALLVDEGLEVGLEKSEELEDLHKNSSDYLIVKIVLEVTQNLSFHLLEQLFLLRAIQLLLVTFLILRFHLEIQVELLREQQLDHFEELQESEVDLVVLQELLVQVLEVSMLVVVIQQGLQVDIQTDCEGGNTVLEAPDNHIEILFSERKDYEEDGEVFHHGVSVRAFFEDADQVLQFYLGDLYRASFLSLLNEEGGFGHIDYDFCYVVQVLDVVGFLEQSDKFVEVFPVGEELVVAKSKLFSYGQEPSLDSRISTSHDLKELLEEGFLRLVVE